jgi:deoxyxylulose-5-phosphate synthase
MVFLHDFFPGAASYEWSKVYPEFAGTHRVLAPDWIGFGESERPDRALRAEDYAQSLQEFVRATCGGRRPVLVGSGVGAAIIKEFTGLPFGKAELRRSGRRIAILAFGSMLHPALVAAESIDATVVNMRWVKPVDADMIRELALTHEAFVTVEEHAVAGGAGSACLEAMAALGLAVPTLQLGLKDHFIDHGDPALLLRLEGLDGPGIAQSISERFAHLLGAGDPTPRLVAAR